MTLTGNIGTAAYMSPEMCSDIDDVPDYASKINVLAFGLIRYEVVFGQGVFTGGIPHIIRKRRQGMCSMS